MENIRGKNLIQFLLDLPAGYSLYLDFEQINDLALIDNFTWYSIDVYDKLKEVYIKKSAALT